MNLKTIKLLAPILFLSLSCFAFGQANQAEECAPTFSLEAPELKAVTLEEMLDQQKDGVFHLVEWNSYEKASDADWDFGKDREIPRSFSQELHVFVTYGLSLFPKASSNAFCKKGYIMDLESKFRQWPIWLPTEFFPQSGMENDVSLGRRDVEAPITFLFRKKVSIEDITNPLENTVKVVRTDAIAPYKKDSGQTHEEIMFEGVPLRWPETYTADQKSSLTSRFYKRPDGFYEVRTRLDVQETSDRNYKNFSYSHHGRGVYVFNSNKELHRKFSKQIYLQIYKEFAKETKRFISSFHGPSEADGVANIFAWKIAMRPDAKAFFSKFMSFSRLARKAIKIDYFESLALAEALLFHPNPNKTFATYTRYYNDARKRKEPEWSAKDYAAKKLDLYIPSSLQYMFVSF